MFDERTLSDGHRAVRTASSAQRLLREVLTIVEASTLEIDRASVEAAFAFACERHAHQRRLSGEAFISHPVGVAKICASMRLDTETLCAALLHDTVEDTLTSLNEVREHFGAEIATLVDGVTKPDGVMLRSPDAAGTQSHHKVMLAMASDVRVIRIKLADRLHNMRTIEAMPRRKQIAKATETLAIYAPIAHRLGIHSIGCELENLALRALHPRADREIEYRMRNA